MQLPSQLSSCHSTWTLEPSSRLWHGGFHLHSMSEAACSGEEVHDWTSAGRVESVAHSRPSVEAHHVWSPHTSSLCQLPPPPASRNTSSRNRSCGVKGGGERLWKKIAHTSGTFSTMASGSMKTISSFCRSSYDPCLPFTLSAASLLGLWRHRLPELLLLHTQSCSTSNQHFHLSPLSPGP